MSPTAIPLQPAWFNGVASVEATDAGLRPWRLPHPQHHLFPSPNDGLLHTAACTSGVRLRLWTDTTELTLSCAPLPPARDDLPDGHAFDLVVDNEIVEVARGVGEATAVTFTEGLPAGGGTVELWLPPSCPVTVTGLAVNAGATVQPRPDRRPLWVTWGSSLTHCVRAGSAARTWPATVARRHDLNLLNLGFGGQCHLDPLVARFIRDLPAAYITLKLGINTINGSVNARTYPALATAAVAIIRERHPHTPLVLISPIAYPPHETEPNRVDYTIKAMRQDLAQVHRRLVAAGDTNLYYVNGLDLFSVEEIATYASDRCHPNAEGMDVQAEHFCKHVLPLLRGA